MMVVVVVVMTTAAFLRDVRVLGQQSVEE